MAINNKYIAFIKKLIALKEEELDKLGDLNAEILFMVTELARIREEEEKILATESHFNDLKKRKINYKQELKKLLSGDLKVSGVMSFVAALCFINVLGLTLPTIGLSVLFASVISASTIEHDSALKNLNIFNKTTSLLELDNQLSSAKDAKQKLETEKKACEENLKGLKGTKVKRKRFIEDLTATINMIAKEYDNMIEKLLNGNSHSIDRDFMTQIKPDILERLRKQKKGIE